MLFHNYNVNHLSVQLLQTMIEFILFVSLVNEFLHSQGQRFSSDAECCGGLLLVLATKYPLQSRVSYNNHQSYRGTRLGVNTITRVIEGPDLESLEL